MQGSTENKKGIRLHPLSIAMIVVAIVLSVILIFALGVTRSSYEALRNSMNHLVQGEDCYVGTNQEYAIYHEFGTGIYCEGGGGRQTPWTYQDAHGEWHRTRGLRPIHFLKNAIAEHTSEYQQIIEQQLKG